MNFLKEILLGFIELIGVAIILKFVELLFLFLVNRKKYTINGFWISCYNSAFDSDIKANDIVEIHSMGNRLIITYQQYYNKSIECNVFRGEGYVSSNGCVSFSYFFDSSDARHVGTMILSQIDLKSTHKALKGKFFEYDTRKGIKEPLGDKTNALNLYDEDYFMIKCNLTLKQKIKFYLNKPVYQSHKAVKNKYEETIHGFSL